MLKTQPFDNYTAEYEDWFTKNRAAYESELEAVRRLLPEGDSGIEVGVGTGKFAVPLGITLGIEPSGSMRDVAVKKGIRVAAGTAEQLPVASGSVDFVLMVTVLCFFKDVPQALREAYRVVKPGGAIVIAFIDRESPLGKKYDEGKGETLFYKDATFFAAEEVGGFLESAGFRDLVFVQTVFRSHKEDEEIQPIRDGHGDGVFVVVKGKKKV
jgi:ubiquinone/menaquinone biosynthesis C-methylase UbiE